jgi:hypothetical protein
VDGRDVSVDGGNLDSLRGRALLDNVLSAARTCPGVSTEVVTASAEFGPFNSVAGVIGDGSVIGIPVLLEVPGGTGAHEFNTTSGRPAPASDPAVYQHQMFNAATLNEYLDTGGNPVWAVFTA